MGYPENPQRGTQMGQFGPISTTALLQIGQVGVWKKVTTQVAKTTGICSTPLISDR